MTELQSEAYFRQLYDLYHPVVYAYLLAHVNHRETAKDLLQEVFLRVWNHMHVGTALGIDESRYWIYRIAKNIVIDYYRRRSTVNQVQERLMAEQTLMNAAACSAEEAYASQDRVRDIESAIRRLPVELRRVIILQAVGRMNSTEIGEMLEMPPGTVRYQLSMARRRLRLELAQLQEEGIHHE
jgi:RNA polymerase sigma-70 factor, ECF subfamily